MTVREHYTARYGTHKWLSRVNPENLASELFLARRLRGGARLYSSQRRRLRRRALALDRRHVGRRRPRCAGDGGIGPIAGFCRWLATNCVVAHPPGDSADAVADDHRRDRPKQNLRCIDIARQACQHCHGECRQREGRCEGAPGFNRTCHAGAHAPGIPAARAANLRRIWISVPRMSIPSPRTRQPSVNQRRPDRKCRATMQAARRIPFEQAHLLPIPRAAPRLRAPAAPPGASRPASMGRRAPGV